MTLVDPDQFADDDCARIYIAARLREAKTVEATLSAQGIDYTVQVERFRSRLLGVIPREYDGAAFYVRGHQAEWCRRLLYDANLRAGLVDEDSDEGS